MAKKTQQVLSRNVTENVTGVYRLPVTIKTAVEAEAEADGTTPAMVVRQALAHELERRGYDLAPETRAACGVD
jgi:hypothetical protein